MAKEDNDDWSTIDLNEGNTPEKVEFEIEGQEEAESAAASEPKEKTVKSAEKADAGEKFEEAEAVRQEQETRQEDQPEELKGIETNGAQKRIRQLIRQRKERDEEIRKLREEVQGLRGSVSSKDKELSETVKYSIDSNESQIQSRIESAKQAFKAAAEQGDSDRMLAAQEEISKSYAEQVALRERKAAWERYNQEVQQTAQRNVEAVQAQKNVPQYDPKALDWASRNEWFGKDQVMTSAALAIDAELKEEGFSPDDEEYYEEIDSRLRNQFPSKFRQVQQAVKQEEQATPRLQDSPTNSAQVVSGASRTPKTSSSGSKKVKLTQEDIRLAQKWGISLEQYAAEKLKVEQSDGDYTTVS